MSVTVCSVLAALAGLCVITFCFKLILDADSIFGDSNVAVSDKSEQEAAEAEFI